MVKLMGHLGMALLWAAPVWFVWRWRVSLAFIALVLTTAMLPDVDLVLENVLPIDHHGITHTVVFVTVVALGAGAVAEYGLRSWVDRIWFRRRGIAISTGTTYVFIAGGFLLGGLSHLFADMLSAPDIAEPLEPLWPIFDKPVSVDVIWYSSFWWNVGLLTVAVLLHLVLAYAEVAVDHPFQVSGEAES